VFNDASVFTHPADLQAAQDAAIFSAQAMHDESDGLRVEGISAGTHTPVGKQEVLFSDGEKVLLSKQQIAAIRMM
jgi:hypothetical protein